MSGELLIAPKTNNYGTSWTTKAQSSPLPEFKEQTSLSNLKNKYKLEGKNLTTAHKLFLLVSEKSLGVINYFISIKEVESELNNVSAKLVTGRNLTDKDLRKIDSAAARFIKKANDKNLGVSEKEIRTIVSKALVTLTEDKENKQLVEFTLEKKQGFFSERKIETYYIYGSESKKETGLDKLNIIEKKEKKGEGSFVVATRVRKFYSQTGYKVLKQLKISAESFPESIDRSLDEYLKEFSFYNNIISKDNKISKSDKKLIDKHVAPPPSTVIYDSVNKQYGVLVKEQTSDLEKRLTAVKDKQEVSGEIDIKAQIQGLIRVLAVLHKLGFVHGDLKPENILVDGDNNLLLTDFGKALNVTADEFKKDIEIRGTNLFIKDYSNIGKLNSKDENERKEFIQAMDAFAFGLTAYLLVTGRTTNSLQKEFDAASDSGKLGWGPRLERYEKFHNLNQEKYKEGINQAVSDKKIDRKTADTIIGLLNPDYKKRFTFAQSVEQLNGTESITRSSYQSTASTIREDHPLAVLSMIKA